MQALFRPAITPPPIERPVSTRQQASQLSLSPFPRGQTDGFRGGIAAYQDRLHGRGFQGRASARYRFSTAESVWRFVTADPATFAPPQVIVKAVFLPGFEKARLPKICGIAICTGTGAAGVFPRSIVRCLRTHSLEASSPCWFIRRRLRRLGAAPPEHPTGYRKE